MKNLVLMLVMFVFGSVQSQEKFVYNSDGLTQGLVVEIESVSQEDIYQKSINWIKESYNNPDEVIVTRIENEKIRFSGYERKCLMTKSLGMKGYNDVRYTVEVSFKDGKYRFEVISLESYTEPSSITRGGWGQINLVGNGLSGVFGRVKFYKKSGKIKSVFKYYPENIERLFNGLNDNLKNYLMRKNNLKHDSSSDW